MPKSNYSSIETIIKIAKKGGMFILVDDEKRENEGDLVISTSEIKISVLISSKSVKKAVAVLHKEFKLD